MAESRISTLRALWAPKLVKVALIGVGLVAGYDSFSSQFGLPTLGTLLGMSGNLLPWWGWLLILQAIFVYALFEYVRRNATVAPVTPNPNESINSRVRSEVTDLRRRVKQLEDDGRAPEPELVTTPKLSFTPKEKHQAKDILVALADVVRDSWVPLFDSARWLHGAQDVYAQNLPTLPELEERANQVTRQIQKFQNEHDHMLEIMGLNLNMTALAQAAASIEMPIGHYIGRVNALGEDLSDGAIQLLQSLAEPVRDAFALYDHHISVLQRTVTRMRKEIDA